MIHALLLVAGLGYGVLFLLRAVESMPKSRPSKQETLAMILVAALLLPAATCVRDFGIGVGEGVVGGIKDEFRPRATPTPAPTQEPTRTPVIISPTPTWTPSPSPAPTQTPGVPEPTSTPVPPAGRDLTTCLRRDEVPAHPVPIFTGKPCKIREGFMPIEQGGCVRNWLCADGDQEYQPVKKIGDSLRWGGPEGVHRCGEYICDKDRPGQEAYGRNVDGNGNVIVPPVGDPDHDTPWSRAGLCKPVWCEEVPQATPTRTPAPSPEPPVVIPSQPRDFRLNFVNGCDALRYPRQANNGQDVKGQCDTTPRYIGTLKSGKRWGNACDDLHYKCAKVVCDGITAEQLQAHVDTYELCAGRWWDSAMGSRIETDPPIHVERDDENPYQHWMTAPDGAEINVRACPGALPVVTLDGLTVPTGGDGCGPWKRVKFEVKP